MEVKKIFGTIFLFIGAISLVLGILGFFEGTNVGNLSPWTFTIIGLLFFSSGITLVKTLRKQNAN